jgi:hypothetical protein
MFDVGDGFLDLGLCVFFLLLNLLLLAAFLGILFSGFFFDLVLFLVFLENPVFF